jgi:Ricin-type beta-trefoil lectin domain-like
MLEAWCAANSTYASCDSLKPSNIDDGLGAFRVTSDTLVNCTTSNSTQSLGYTDGTTTTNTVGTKVEISGKLFGIVQTKLEVSYQHAWAESHSVTKTVTITVAPGEYGWIATAQRMQNVTADFHVTLGNQTYDVPNSSRDAVQLELGKSSDGRNQQWRFIESPANADYFEVQSDNNPKLCLDLSGTDGKSILQWPCSHTDNELWSVTYDPTNKGFRISDKAEPDKALDTEGGKVEPGTKIVASDAAAARRWVFKRVG